MHDSFRDGNLHDLVQSLNLLRHILRLNVLGIDFAVDFLLVDHVLVGLVDLLVELLFKLYHALEETLLQLFSLSHSDLTLPLLLLHLLRSDVHLVSSCLDDLLLFCDLCF